MEEGNNMTLVQQIRFFNPDFWEQSGSRVKAKQHPKGTNSKKANASPASTNKKEGESRMVTKNTKRFIAGIGLISIWVLVILAFAPKTGGVLDPLAFGYWSFITLISAGFLMAFGIVVCFGILIIADRIYYKVKAVLE